MGNLLLAHLNLLVKVFFGHKKGKLIAVLEDFLKSINAPATCDDAMICCLLMRMISELRIEGVLKRIQLQSELSLDGCVFVGDESGNIAFR